MHGNHPFLAVLRQLHQSSPLALAHVQLKSPPSADAIAAAVKRSGLSRQRSLDKLQFVVDPATMAQVELKVHSPRNKTLTNPRCQSANLHGPVRTSQMLAQSPSLQRALKSAAALRVGRRPAVVFMWTNDVCRDPAVALQPASDPLDAPNNRFKSNHPGHKSWRRLPHHKHSRNGSSGKNNK
ncbi:hypothetical protein DYB26_015956 [Aphanomyces astaci]|nr:hypothetical protein DYB26_015956 [Aphanomyces astaci]